MICPYCKKEAVWCENKEIYGKNYGKSVMCYYCKPCDAYVGCHQNSKNALGSMANRELRDLRKKAHALFDPLWKTGKMSRDDAYKLLGDKLGLRNVHIAQSDKSLCEKIIKVLTEPLTLPERKG